MESDGMARHLCWLRPFAMQNPRADELICRYKEHKLPLNPEHCTLFSIGQRRK